MGPRSRADSKTEGRLEFRGPSATSGYFRNEAKTRALFHDGWLDTGDRAYIADADLFVTGRTKDIISARASISTRMRWKRR